MRGNTPPELPELGPNYNPPSQSSTNTQPSTPSPNSRPNTPPPSILNPPPQDDSDPGETSRPNSRPDAPPPSILNPPPQDDSDPGETSRPNSRPDAPPPSILNPPPQDDSDSGDDDSDNGGFENLDKDGDGFYDSDWGGEGGDGGDPGGGGKPVFLDLDGDGVELVSLEDSNAAYDIRGDGYRYNLSWVGPDDGILAYDRDGDGQISQRDEISFVDDVEDARTDLEGLRHFDTNADSQLTSADDEWSKFRVWQDRDGDGVSDPGELRTLDAAGVRAISLASTGEVETRPDGTRVFGRGTYTTGSEDSPVTRELLDVSLSVAPWGFRETDGNVEFRWTDGEESFGVFVAASDAPVTLDLAAAGHNMAIGGAGADRFSNSGTRSVLLLGLAGGDVLRGGAGTDLILGGAGDDELHGGGGSDVLSGDAGADRVDGGAGDDAVQGGAGADTLDGGDGSDTVSYATSNAGVTVDLRDADADGFHDTASGGHASGDRIRGFENVVGSAHDDVLTGDAGANWLLGGWQELYGEAGSDTYVIGSADGQVRIGSSAESATTGRSDRVVFTDLALSEVEFTHHGSPRGGTTNSVDGVALVIRWTKAGVSGEVHIAEMGRHIERFEFADGSVLGRVDANWRARSNPSAYPGDTQDRLIGTGQDDTITTGASADWLEGGAGNDLLDGGMGGDTLDGGAGRDTLKGGAGDDRLTGGGGDDTLVGGGGDDVYTFSGRRFGRDRIVDTAGNDIIEFSGVTREQLRFYRNNRDLVIRVADAKSEVTVKSWWHAPWRMDENRGRQVEAIHADGYSLSARAVSQLVQAMAGMRPSPSGPTSQYTRGSQHTQAPLSAWEEITGS